MNNRRPMNIQTQDFDRITKLQKVLSAKLSVDLKRVQVLRLALAELEAQHLSDAA